MKVVKISNSSVFYASAADKIFYEDWHLQMLSKISINKSSTPIEAAKKVYLQSFTTDNALAQLKLRLKPNATRPFATTNEIFEVLTATFGNANEKQKNKAKY